MGYVLNRVGASALKVSQERTAYKFIKSNIQGTCDGCKKETDTFITENEKLSKTADEIDPAKFLQEEKTGPVEGPTAIQENSGKLMIFQINLFGIFLVFFTNF